MEQQLEVHIKSSFCRNLFTVVQIVKTPQNLWVVRYSSQGTRDASIKIFYNAALLFREDNWDNIDTPQNIVI